MNEAPKEMTNSQQLSQEGLWKGPRLLAVILMHGTRQLTRGQASEGEEHLLLTPALAPQGTDLPLASLGQELCRVYGYGEPEKWPRKEALSPAPVVLGHAQRGHPSCYSPQGRTAGQLGEAVRTPFTHL